MTPLRRLFAASIVLVAGSTIVQATDVGGTISTNTTWTAALSPYVVISNVTVNAGVTLTVQPGVTVKFSSGLSLTVNGTLSAAGTSGSRIRFTTNNATPAAGQWNTVILNAGSQASVLDYCDLDYGGSTGSQANLYVQSNATIRNSTSSWANKYGIRINNANPTIQSVTVQNNNASFGAGMYIEGTSAPTITLSHFVSNYYGIYINHSGTASDPNPVVHTTSFMSSTSYHVYLTANYNVPGATLNFENNWWGSADTAAINSKIFDVTDSAALLYVDYIPFLDGDGGAVVPGNFAPRTIAANSTWTTALSPYIVAQDVKVNAGVTLTIQPGVIVKFGGSTSLLVDGTLSAVGTTGSRIRFTTNYTPAAAGQWTSIALNPGSQASVLDYCDVEYGGQSGTSELYVQSSATIRNSTVSYSGRHGIRVNNANPTIQSVTLQNNTSSGAGIYVEGTAAPTITLSTFQSNFYGMYISHSGTGADPSPVVHTSNFLSSSSYHVYSTGSYTVPGATLNFESNWWNTTDTDAINNKIYDNYDNASMPYIDYIPFLSSAGGPIVPGNFAPRFVTSNTTWTAALSPYIVAQDVKVNAAVTLTIQPGVIVKFGGSTSLLVDGTLSAVGTSGSRIRFTSAQAAPAPGQWSAVSLNAGSQASLLEFCDVEYGGQSGTSELYVQSNATIRNSTVSYSGRHGIRVNNANPTIQSVTLQNNTSSGAGIYVEGTAAPTITLSTFQSNYYGVYISHSGTGADPSPVVHTSSFLSSSSYHVYSTGSYTVPGATLNFESNWWNTTDTDAINNKIYDNYDNASMPYIDYIPFLSSAGGPIVPGNFAPRFVAANTTWTAALSPYIVAQDVKVNAGVTLTIQPGVTVKFGGNTGLNVDGTLSAIGNTGSHVVFTTAQATPGPGQWNAVTINSGGNGTFNYCDLLYGGAGTNAAILVVLGPASVQNSLVRYSSNRGIYISGANPTISDTTIKDGTRGIYLNNAGSPVFTRVRVTNNTYGFVVFRGTGLATPDPNPRFNDGTFSSNVAGHVSISGTYQNPAATWDFQRNWWGTVDMNTIAIYITDHVDNASLPAVDFIPYLASEDGPEYHVVYNVSVVPSVINPDWGELAEIGFQTTVNFTRATFRVYDATTHALVRTAGGNYGELWLGWDGRNDQGGIPTVEQLYYFTIEVRDESGHVAFWNTAGTPLMGPTPGLSNNVVTTPTFDPYRNDQFALDYTSSARGQVSITVINAASATIRTLFDHDLQDAGSHTVLWDGRKDDGSIHQGYFQIQLGPAYAIPDQAIFLHRPGAGFSNVRAEAYLIQSVHTEVSTIRYTLGGYADVTVAIRDPNGNFVKNVSVVAAQPPGTYAVEWDGRNGAGDLMALEGVYTVTLTARDVATGVQTTRKASITVYK